MIGLHTHTQHIIKKAKDAQTDTEIKRERERGTTCKRERERQSKIFFTCKTLSCNCTFFILYFSVRYFLNVYTTIFSPVCRVKKKNSNQHTTLDTVKGSYIFFVLYCRMKKKEGLFHIFLIIE